jgi:hypothetical protein
MAEQPKNKDLRHRVLETLGAYFDEKSAQKCRDALGFYQVLASGNLDDLMEYRNLDNDGQAEGWIARLAASPIPEPSTFTLAGLGLSFIAMRRKR